VRMIPDTLIIIGAGALVLFMFKAMQNLKPVTIHPGKPFA